LLVDNSFEAEYPISNMSRRWTKYLAALRPSAESME